MLRINLRVSEEDMKWLEAARPQDTPLATWVRQVAMKHAIEVCERAMLDAVGTK